MCSRTVYRWFLKRRWVAFRSSLQNGCGTAVSSPRHLRETLKWLSLLVTLRFDVYILLSSMLYSELVHPWRCFGSFARIFQRADGYGITHATAILVCASPITGTAKFARVLRVLSRPVLHRPHRVCSEPATGSVQSQPNSGRSESLAYWAG